MWFCGRRIPAGHSTGRGVEGGERVSANGAAMNRAFLIILVPVGLVAIGYVVVFRAMGVSPGYWRLALVGAVVTGAMWWLGRKTARKAKAGAR